MQENTRGPRSKYLFRNFSQNWIQYRRRTMFKVCVLFFVTFLYVHFMQVD